MGSPGTDAEAPVQPGRCSWSLLDRMRACARGGEGQLGQDGHFQATQKLLRPLSGIPGPREAQRAAVQAQQRRERAERRNLVRELQSRVCPPLPPSATPSERITECLNRGSNTPPEATSHGAGGINAHERESQAKGEVISHAEYLRIGNMGPSAIPENKVQQRV
jgi:hypothetical protein